jgi:flagellar FliL protein
MAVIEKRVIASSARPARPGVPGAAPPVPKEGEKEKKAKTKRPKKKLLIMVLAVVLVVAGAAYYFLVMGKSSGPVTPPAPVAGKVLPVTAVSLNLADGHYLRIAVGLQLTKDVAEAPDTAKAVDLMIAMYSGKTVAEVADPTAREALKKQLLTELEKSYEGEVMDLYFTDYVTQ